MRIQILTRTGLATFAVLAGGLLFGAPVVLAAGAPSVVGESVSSVTPFEERLEATVNAGEEAAECHFQYGKTSVSEHEVACEQATIEGGEQGVGLTVAGLEPKTTYDYKVVVKNASGEAEGAEETFTSLALQSPSVDSESVSFLSATHATLEGQVNPNYQATTCSFEYAGEESVLLAGAGTKVPGGSIPAGLGDQPVHANLGEVLSPGTTYYYRIVATNGAGTTRGMVTVSSFTTPVAPQASTGTAVEVMRNAATVSGTVNPEGQETRYTIQYGPTSGYGYSTPPVNVGSEVTDIATGAIVLGSLSPDTTYHYRVLAINNAGEHSAGADETFTTAPAPPPPPSKGEQQPVTPTPPGAAPVGSTFPNLTAIAPIPGPKESAKTPGTTAKSLTRVQKLNKALKACKKAKGGKRASCEKQAHAKYGKSTRKKGK